MKFKNIRNRFVLFLIVILIIIFSYIKYGKAQISQSDWNLNILNKTFIENAEYMCIPRLNFIILPKWKQSINHIILLSIHNIPFLAYTYPEIYEESNDDIILLNMMDERDHNEISEVDQLISTLVGSLSKNKTSNSQKLNLSTKYLLDHYYTVDESTKVKKGQINGKKFMSKDMKLKKLKKEEEKSFQVLIYHTHSQEDFKDSNPKNKNSTIVGVGGHLSKVLNDTYHINTLHHKKVYDLINGKMDRSKAYQLSAQGVRKILKENPSIEVVIDLHRDGVSEKKHFVTKINGKPTAQIMFFNGLSYTKKNHNIAYLKNPYIQDNLAFSFQMQMMAKQKYPDFVRRIYLKGYRYNMNLRPKYLLIEAGAQTNTVKEMYNAMDVLAEVLDGVLK